MRNIKRQATALQAMASMLADQSLFKQQISNNNRERSVIAVTSSMGLAHRKRLNSYENTIFVTGQSLHFKRETRGNPEDSMVIE